MPLIAKADISRYGRNFPSQFPFEIPHFGARVGGRRNVPSSDSKVIGVVFYHVSRYNYPCTNEEIGLIAHIDL